MDEKENGVSDIPVEKGKWSVWANNEIESLRQRVKELININYALEEQVRALKAKQGEPVAWMVSFDAKLGGANVTDKLLIWHKNDATKQVREELIQKVEPLYKAAPKPEE